MAEDNPVRVIDFFVDQLDLAKLGFSGVNPKETGRPSYHPAVMLKVDVYGYVNRVPSSLRLERECQRNVEAMWLTGCLTPDFKTIADFRKDNGAAIRKVCREFVAVCGRVGLLTASTVAIDGSKFKAVNSRDRNFTKAKVAKRLEQIEASIERYLSELETADRQPSTPEIKRTRLKDKVGRLKQEIERMKAIEAQLEKAEDTQISLTDPDARSMQGTGKATGTVGYNVQSAVETENHLIVAHEVTNAVNDRHQLASMAQQAEGGSWRRSHRGACRSRLLRWQGNSRLRGSWRDGVCAKVFNLGRQGRRAFSASRILSTRRTRMSIFDRAPWTALMPTPPVPKTTTVAWAHVGGVDRREQNPVVTPQLTRAAELERDVVLDLHARPLGQHGVLGERAEHAHAAQVLVPVVEAERSRRPGSRWPRSCPRHRGSGGRWSSTW